VELEATGIKTSERLDRMKYEREREANRERITRLRLRIPDGYTEDLEPVEASEAAESPGPTPKPVLEQSLDAVASLLRTGRSLADEQRARRDARRLRRKLDPERPGATNAAKTGRECRRRLSYAPSCAESLAWDTLKCSGAGRLWGQARNSREDDIGWSVSPPAGDYGLQPGLRLSRPRAGRAESCYIHPPRCLS
jgi:hypothetical protein